MKKYFIHNGSEQEGPLDAEELKSKNIKKDTPIWHEGLSEWTTAGNIEELKVFFTPNPPPYLSTASSPPSPPKLVQQSPVMTGKSKNTTGRALLILGGIIVLGLGGFFLYNQIKSQREQSERQSEINVKEDIKNIEEENKARIKNNITSYVTVANNEYNYNPLGGISNLKLTVTNNTDFLIDNVKVKIVYIKVNGEVWDEKTVEFNMISPQSKMILTIPDTERGISIKHQITSIKSNALSLY